MGRKENMHLLDVSADGQYMVTGSRDNSLCVWDMAASATPGVCGVWWILPCPGNFQHRFILTPRHVYEVASYVETPMTSLAISSTRSFNGTLTFAVGFELGLVKIMRLVTAEHQYESAVSTKVWPSLLP